MTSDAKVETQPEAEARISKAVAEKVKIKAERKKTAEAENCPKTNRAMAGVPAAERRRAIVKALKAAKAFNALSAKSIEQLAVKLGYTRYDVYCLVYHKYKLHTDGIVKTTKLEGETQLSAYLTKKGQSIDLDDVG